MSPHSPCRFMSLGDRIPSIFHDWWTRASRVGAVTRHADVCTAAWTGRGPYSRLNIYQINQGLSQGRHFLESTNMRVQ